MKINKFKKFITIHKMGKEIIALVDIEAEKHKFHQHKTPISIYDVNVDRIVVSKKVSFAKKGFEKYEEEK